MAHEHHEDWNPLDPSILADQRAAYDQMRERCPVAHSKLMGWSLFRHEDLVAVLADPTKFINTSRFPAIPNGLNPPEHGPYSVALAEFFNTGHMAKLEPEVRAMATGLLEPLYHSETEFIEAFVRPFVFKTLCVWLGWPDSQWMQLANWVKGNEQVAFSGDALAGKNLADAFARQVLDNLDAHRAALPAQPDTTIRLMDTRVNDERLSDGVIATILRNWVAGHGTTTDALGIVVMHLARNVELQEQLRRTPALIPGAVETILRSDGPLVANRRTTTEEFTVQGRVIPKDASLSLMWIAANRDPRAFPDPDGVNPERVEAASLTWGQGIHLCIGAPLARLEIRAALEQILARTTHFGLTAAEPPRKVYPSNGLAALHLRLA